MRIPVRTVDTQDAKHFTSQQRRLVSLELLLVRYYYSVYDYHYNYNCKAC